MICMWDTVTSMVTFSVCLPLFLLLPENIEARLAPGTPPTLHGCIFVYSEVGFFCTTNNLILISGMNMIKFNDRLWAKNFTVINCLPTV